MSLHILEDLLSHIIPLINVVHPVLHARVLVVHLVLKNLPLCLQVGDPDVDLLKNIQLALRLEYCVSQVLDFVVTPLLIKLGLVDKVRVFNKPVDDWLHDLIHQPPHLGFNIEPKQVEGGIVLGETLVRA